MSLDIVKGIYYYDFRIKGKRYRKTTGIKVNGPKEEQQAKDIENALKAQIILDLRMSPKEKEARARRELWLSEAIEKTYRERWEDDCTDGLRIYRRTKLILDHIEDRPLEDITNAVIIELKQSLKQSGLEPNTINRYLAHLKTVFNHCGVVPPTIEMRSVKKSQRRYLTPEEEERMYNQLTLMGEYDIKDLCLFLIDTGARLGEALGLLWRRIDLNRGTAAFPEREKHGRPTTIPLTPEVVEMLHRRKEANQLKPFGQLTQNRVQNVWRKAKEKIGLGEDKDFVPHSLRHTCATRMVQADVPILTIRDMLGHCNVTVTEEYAHNRNKELEQGVMRVQEHFRKKSKDHVDIESKID